MRPRQIIVFLAIVLTPLGIAAWLGLKVARDEHQAGQHRLQTLLEDRLRDVNSTIAGAIREVERSLLHDVLTEDRAAVDGALDEGVIDALRAARRKEPLVRQLFVVDARGRLVFPPAGEDASAEERAFRTRTAAIWRGDAVLYEPPAPEQTTSATRPRPPDMSPGDSILALAGSHPHGWITWHWEEGLHLLFWRAVDERGVIGAEIERVALLARVVSRLPAAELSEGRVILADSRGDAMHQWGPYEPGPGERPVASTPVQYPLDSWRIVHHVSPAQALYGQTLRMNMIVGLAAVALSLLAMAFFFYRDYARKMRDAAERVGFVTRVSHELRTPLTNIRLYAELMDGDLGEDDEPLRRRLAVIVAESQRLGRLIGNILTFSRQRRGELEVRATEIQVDEVVASVLSQFAPALAARGITCSHTPGAPGPVQADPDALGQIVANLVSNVEKYAASGGVLEVVTTEEPGRVVVRVADRGPGIPAAAREKIFRPFYRVSDRVTDGVTGTGIGLSIARELARAMGGELALVPSEAGACFELWLPRSQEET